MILYVVLLGVVAAIALDNYFRAYRLESFSGRDGDVDALSVSVLVPLRNEARNLPALLHRLEALAYRRMEIVLLDDESSDDTPVLLERWLRSQREDVRVIRGLPRPRGWNGKNWACWQLAEAARGDLLLFMDADVRPSNVAVRRTVEAVVTTDADALTAIPYQRLDSWLEQLVVPMVLHFAPAGLLPLRLLAEYPTPKAVFANGQWLAVRRDMYLAAGGHRAVRQEILDDVALGRAVIRAGGTLVPVVATRDLAVRMYEDADAVREGFGKNLAAIAGGRLWSVVLGALLWMALFAAPFPVGIWQKRIDVVALALAGQLAILRLFRRPVHELLLVPFGAVATAVLLVYSWGWTRSGKAQWRGRPLSQVEA